MRLFSYITGTSLFIYRSKFPQKIYIAFYSTTKYDLNISIRGFPLQNYVKQLENDYENGTKEGSFPNKRILELKAVIHILNDRKLTVNNISNLAELLNGQDKELCAMAEEEMAIFENKIKTIDENLLDALLPTEEYDGCNSIVLETTAGVGGKEAMLFASELFEMYSNFAQFNGWVAEVADYAVTDLGGIRHGSLLINGNQVFKYFKHEAGVHRVQRIPTTEKAGRIHTSTVSVVAIPQPTDIEIKIDNKDLRIETKRASGAGGQHVNTTDSAVRIVHLPTNLAVECQVDRSQIKNRRIAMAKLRALLYQREIESQKEQSQSIRKNQVRTNFRNEKIRTYNFPQDRVTDHRMQGCNIHNLKGFLQGNLALKELMDNLDYHNRVEMLLDLVNTADK